MDTHIIHISISLFCICIVLMLLWGIREPYDPSAPL